MPGMLACDAEAMLMVTRTRTRTRTLTLTLTLALALTLIIRSLHKIGPEDLTRKGKGTDFFRDRGWGKKSSVSPRYQQ